jgi:hypothetical protein
MNRPRLPECMSLRAWRTRFASWTRPRSASPPPRRARPRSCSQVPQHAASLASVRLRVCRAARRTSPRRAAQARRRLRESTQETSVARHPQKSPPETLTPRWRPVCRRHFPDVRVATTRRPLGFQASLSDAHLACRWSWHPMPDFSSRWACSRPRKPCTQCGGGIERSVGARLIWLLPPRRRSHHKPYWK